MRNIIRQDSDEELIQNKKKMLLDLTKEEEERITNNISKIDWAYYTSQKKLPTKILEICLSEIEYSLDEEIFFVWLNICEKQEISREQILKYSKLIIAMDCWNCLVLHQNLDFEFIISNIDKFGLEILNTSLNYVKVSEEQIIKYFIYLNSFKHLFVIFEK